MDRTPLNTQADLEVFACELEMANIVLPANCSIFITIALDQFNAIVPEDLRENTIVEYNSPIGMRFMLCRPEKTLRETIYK